MDQGFKAIAQPTRRQILELVVREEMTSGDIAAHFELTQPAISQHLKVLTEAGLATVRREGTRRIYRARPEGLVELRGFIDQIWQVGLERLKRAAEEEHQEQDHGRERAR